MEALVSVVVSQVGQVNAEITLDALLLYNDWQRRSGFHFSLFLFISALLLVFFLLRRHLYLGLGLFLFYQLLAVFNSIA